MRRHSVPARKALNVFPIIMICFTLCSCSSMKNFVGFFKFWDSDKSAIGTSVQDDEGAAFQVRAPRRNVEAYYNLGCYYQERDRHREAIEEFRKTVSLDPAHVKALNRMGISYDEIKDFPKAVACYEAAIKAEPAADYTYNNLAHSYRLQGRFEESVDTFKKALALNSQSSRIHNNLGLVYTMMGQHELATKEFELASTLAKPASPIEQAKDKQDVAPSATTTVRENPKPAEDAFTQAELVQPNATPIGPVTEKAAAEATVRPQKKTETAVAAVNAPVVPKTPVAPSSSVASVPPKKEAQPVITAANTRTLEAKSHATPGPVASAVPPIAKAPAPKTAEVQKVATQPKEVAKAKPQEVAKVARAIEVTKVPVAKKAIEPDKTLTVKKAPEIKKVAATSVVAKDRPVSQPKSMSLVLTNKATVKSVKPRGIDFANPERFYAALARSIVRATPENLVPKRMVRSNRPAMNVNLLLRNDMMPGSRFLLEDYT